MNAESGTAGLWRAGSALIDEAYDNVRRITKLPLIWQKAQRIKKGATPSEVVWEDGHVKLLHYLADEPRKFRTPVVFVFALVNRPYILDLMPGRSVVGHFVRAGFDTYLIDWGVPTQADRHRTLDSYVNGYLPDALDRAMEWAEADQASVLGYCMGGTMSAISTALHPQRVRNLILLAAGIDFSTRDGLLNVWTDPKTFDVDAFVEAYGNCPAEFLQASFLMLKPVGNFMEKPIGLFERANDDKFVEEYLTMETWLNDNIPVPGEVYREFVKYLYQRNLLAKGQLRIGRRRVDLRQITCPVLNIMAAKDDLVPCAQSEPFNDLVGSKDTKIMKLPAGHIGLAMGSRAQRELWPAACEWLAERSDPLARAHSS